MEKNLQETRSHIGMSCHEARHSLHFFMIIALSLVGCGTGGYLVTEEQIAQITVGESTKQNIRKILGEPEAVSSSTISGMQFETWHYAYAKYASDPYTGVPPIGVIASPISRAQRKTTEIEVTFDKNDIVSTIQDTEAYRK